MIKYEKEYVICNVLISWSGTCRMLARSEVILLYNLNVLGLIGYIQFISWFWNLYCKWYILLWRVNLSSLYSKNYCYFSLFLYYNSVNFLCQIQFDKQNLRCLHKKTTFYLHNAVITKKILDLTFLHVRIFECGKKM